MNKKYFLQKNSCYQISFAPRRKPFRGLVSILGTTFPGMKHLKFEGLSEMDDKTVWEFAVEKECCILTKDWDFKFMSIAFGCPPKVVRLACGNRTTSFIADLLKRKFDVIGEFPDSEIEC